MRGSVKAYAPATVSNLNCGFDILGFAVERPGDEVTASCRDRAGVVIECITGDGGRLPLDPEKNTAGVAVQALLAHLDMKTGISLQLDKKMPLGSGMGSSAASAAAALCAVNALLGEPLSKLEMLPFALEAERAACGTAHADNAAPSLLGGLVLIRSYRPLDVVQLPVPQQLCCALVHPSVEVLTGDARRLLPQQVPLHLAVTQWGNVAGLVAGLLLEDLDLVGRSLQDVIVEPARAPLIPGYYQVREAALAAGALGSGISGSGPSLFALAGSLGAAQESGRNMQAAFASLGIPADVHVSAINRIGATVVSG